VRGRRLQYSSGGGGSSGRWWGQQGPAASEVKEEGVGHEKTVRRRPRAVLTWEGVRRQRSSSILTTVAALQWPAAGKRRWGEEGIAAGLYRWCGDGGQWRGSIWRAPHSGPRSTSVGGRRHAIDAKQGRGTGHRHVGLGYSHGRQRVDLISNEIQILSNFDGFKEDLPRLKKLK
jgi:hypothetical protein